MNPLSPDIFHKEAATFIGDLHSAVLNLKINVANCVVDHVCYRVDSLTGYQEMKTQLSKIGRLLTEAHVNGRPITTYKLHTPIDVPHVGQVSLVELPSPKPGVNYPEGFEHIEYVYLRPLIISCLRMRSFRVRAHSIGETIILNCKSKLESSL